MSENTQTSTPLSVSQLSALLSKGGISTSKPFVLAEYRNTFVEPYDYVSKKTGRRAQGYSVTHNFETSDTMVQCQEIFSREAMPEAKDYKTPMEKGKEYILVLEKWAAVMSDNRLTQANNVFAALVRRENIFPTTR